MKGPDWELRRMLDTIAQLDERNQLRPEEVLEAARSPTSVLHHCFEWNDGQAAHRWRLHQARMLIRRYWVVIDQQPPVRTRAYVSLKSDRVRGGGYTPIRRVLSEPALHTELLRNARADLDEMQRRYGQLEELKPLFQVWQKVRRRMGRSRMHVAA